MICRRPPELRFSAGRFSRGRVPWADPARHPALQPNKRPRRRLFLSPAVHIGKVFSRALPPPLNCGRIALCIYAREVRRVTYRHTLYASYLGYVTQAICNNLPPLLFVTFNERFGV